MLKRMLRKKEQQRYRFIKNNIILLFIFFLSLLFSPVKTPLFLFLPSIYYIYKGNYKNLYLIWVFHMVSWYLLFAGCFFNFEGPIIIGGWFTWDLVLYTKDTYSGWSTPFNWLGYTLRKFCMQTLEFLSFVSDRLGCRIYIPNIFKGILFLIQYFF